MDRPTRRTPFGAILLICGPLVGAIDHGKTYSLGLSWVGRQDLWWGPPVPEVDVG